MLRGVGGVLGEMGDNVVWHAFETRDNPCLAMAGFHVDGNIASFCVADFGQGFLRSLCRSERWRHLATDSEALEAVVRQRATSRPGEQTGDGFKRVFDSLVQFNGLVILRSGNCTYRLENAGGINQELIRESSSVPGSSVTVVIALEADPSEKKLRI
jgi:hypothetical protein